MSKFIDKLNQVSRAVPQPMGFGAAQSAREKPKMLLVASLAQVNVDGLADYVAGADAGLLPIAKLSSGARALRKVCQVVTDIPWGLWLGDTGRGGIKEIVKAGCDFVVFPANMSLAILQDDKVGKILQVEASFSEALLRSIGELPVDAVFMASGQEGENFLSWYHLMLSQRLADLSTKPLLVSVPPDVTAHELQVLGEMGVKGVVIAAGVGQAVERVKELRQAIDKLVFQPKPKRGKAEALLPRITGAVDMATEEEEEEEEE